MIVESFAVGEEAVGTGMVDWKSPFGAALEPTLEVLRTTLKARGATDGQVRAAMTTELDAFFESFTENANEINIDFSPGGGAASGGYFLMLTVDAGCRFVMEAEGELTGGYDAATREMGGEATLETTVTVSGGALPNGDPCPQPPPFTGTTTWSATFDPLTLTVRGTVSAVEIPPEFATYFATYAAHNAFDLPFTISVTLDDEVQEAGSSGDANSGVQYWIAVYEGHNNDPFFFVADTRPLTVGDLEAMGWCPGRGPRGATPAPYELTGFGPYDSHDEAIATFAQQLRGRLLGERGGDNCTMTRWTGNRPISVSHEIYDAITSGRDDGT